MKTQMRVALPPLTELRSNSLINVGVLGRHGRMLRRSQLELRELAALSRRVSVILHPADAVVTDVHLPPLPSHRLEAAVQASIEPMVLGELADLCVAHGPRAADGRVTVAWVNRNALLHAWQLLAESGLQVDHLTPFSLAVDSTHLGSNATLDTAEDSAWVHPLPSWSLANPRWRPRSAAGRWKAAVFLTLASGVLWVGGLNVYASRLLSESEALNQQIDAAFRSAFPDVAVVLDPLVQAEQALDRLRGNAGLSRADDFLPLAHATAQVFGAAQGKVVSVTYNAGRLTLRLSENPAPDATQLVSRAAQHGLLLSKVAESERTWQVERAQAVMSRGEQP